MFITNDERKQKKWSSAYFEFQFCKSKKINSKIQYWLDDSIYINDEDFNILFYNKYIDLIDVDNFDYYGSNYYGKECAIIFLSKIEEINSREFDLLKIFLKEGIEKYNGFYIIGI